MLHRIAKVFHFSEGVIVAPAPVVLIAAPQVYRELLEQDFMDKMFAKRNFVRFVFLALVAALCLKVVLA